MQSLDLHKAGRLHSSHWARQCSCLFLQSHSLLALENRFSFTRCALRPCSQWAWTPRNTDAGQRRQRQQGPGARRAARRGHGMGSGGLGMLRRPEARVDAVRR
jgi:hypothetical protein